MATTKKKDPDRKAQEAHVRLVGRTCVGPLLIKPKEEKARWVRWRALEDAGDWEGALEMITALVATNQKHCNKGFKLQARPLPEKGDWPALRRVSYPQIRLRSQTVGQGCGWNLNEEIVKHPFDGEEHVTTCPDCGAEHSWKAPVFD